MGNIRTPKPHYFNNGLVEFYVKNKQVHYKTLIWINNGSSQFVLDAGLYKNDIDDIVKRGLQKKIDCDDKSKSASQNFSIVGRNEK